MNEVRCPWRRPDGRPCGQKLGDAQMGYYRTTCPRCKRPVVLVTGGMLDVHNEGLVLRVRVEVEDVTAARAARAG